MKINDDHKVEIKLGIILVVIIAISLFLWQGCTSYKYTTHQNSTYKGEKAQKSNPNSCWK